MHNNTNNSQRFRTDNSSPEAGPPVQPNVSPQPTQVPSSLTSQPAPLQPPQQATPIEEAAPNQSPSGLEPLIKAVYGHFGD